MLKRDTWRKRERECERDRDRKNTPGKKVRKTLIKLKIGSQRERKIKIFCGNLKNSQLLFFSLFSCAMDNRFLIGPESLSFIPSKSQGANLGEIDSVLEAQNGCFHFTEATTHQKQKNREKKKLNRTNKCERWFVFPEALGRLSPSKKKLFFVLLGCSQISI